MAETSQVIFSHKEVVEALIKHHGIHKGIWTLLVQFGIQGVNVGLGGPNPLPAAVVPVVALGLQKTSQINSMSVDAAEVNPSIAQSDNKEKRMAQRKSLVEFEGFVRDKGHKVEKGIVIFEQDGEAAQKFYTEASNAGFDAVKDFNQAGSYAGLDDLSKLPTYWYVRLAP